MQNPAPNTRSTRKLSRAARQAVAGRLERLNRASEAAGLAMAVTEEELLVPRLRLEDHSASDRTAEDAWRAERREPLVRKKSKSLLGDWSPAGWMQMVSGRATA